MKKVQLRLAIAVLLLVIITQSFTERKHPLPTTKRFQAQNATNKKGQALTDVTLLFHNDFPNDFDVWLYNTITDTGYFFNIHPNQYEYAITVPEGTYDLTFWPDDQGKNHHYYSVACGPSGGGFGTYSFWGISITSAMYCNTINIE